jgi:hypothetical protein
VANPTIVTAVSRMPSPMIERLPKRSAAMPHGIWSSA